MRAAIVTEPGGPEVLQVREIDTPEPGPEEALVKIHASALNRADLSQRAGGYPAPPGIRPDVPGLEMAGEVVAVGSRVTQVAVGDRVCALLGGGGYAEYTAIDQAMAAPIPEGMSYTEAASVPEVFFTAYDALFNWCGLTMGESALIHAAGSGVGVAAVQLAKAAGAAVFGTASSGEKLEKAKGLGLDVGVNYNIENFAEVVKRETDGRGVDVILDVVGAPYWNDNIASLAIKGRMVLVGTLGGGRLEANIAALMPKRLSVFGTVLRMRAPSEKARITDQFKRHVLPLFHQGRLRPVVDRVFPLDEVAEAHRYMESNANFGKIVLQVV